MINKGILIDRQFDAELFADNLRLLREGKGLTQAELGSLCGISENAIRNYELGHCFPKTATLNALANALEPYTKCSIPKAKANANTIRMARYFA